MAAQPPSGGGAARRRRSTDDDRDDGRPCEAAPSREEARLPAAVGVHDPVPPDRRRRARDVDHPGRPYDYNADGTPIPGTYHTVPARTRPGSSSTRSMAPINGMYGIKGADGSISLLQQRRAVRRHRRGPVHPGHRRLPGRDDEDRRDPGGHRARRRAAARPRAAADPDPDGAVRPGRHDASAWPRRASPSTCWSSR